MTKQGITVNHEIIYLHVYRDKVAGGNLYEHFRHPCKSYRKRGSGLERCGRLKHQAMVDKRPKIVDERSRIGDWEMDIVIDQISEPVLVTMVERVSSYKHIAIASKKEPTAMGAVIIKTIKQHREKVLTTTCDNGKAWAMYKLVREALEADTYFAHPSHSWERGLNENTNGLIRQYFPKVTEFSKVTAIQVVKVKSRLLCKRRKCLDYLTPNAIFHSIPLIGLAA